MRYTTPAIPPPVRTAANPLNPMTALACGREALESPPTVERLSENRVSDPTNFLELLMMSRIETRDPTILVQRGSPLKTTGCRSCVRGIDAAVVRPHAAAPSEPDTASISILTFVRSGLSQCPRPRLKKIPRTRKSAPGLVRFPQSTLRALLRPCSSKDQITY
jgi:hypothetical protein